MLVAVFIPGQMPLALALSTRSARHAIDRGFNLYTDGQRSALLPAPRAGWFRLAVTARDMAGIAPGAGS